MSCCERWVDGQLCCACPRRQSLPMRATVAAGKATRWELLVSASAVMTLVGSLAYASASVLFANAFGVLSDDELLEIVSATEEQVFGQPYVYRLVLRAPLAQVT